jgi:hypothetical protein
MNCIKLKNLVSDLNLCASWLEVEFNYTFWRANEETRDGKAKIRFTLMCMEE